MAANGAFKASKYAELDHMPEYDPAKTPQLEHYMDYIKDDGETGIVNDSMPWREFVEQEDGSYTWTGPVGRGASVKMETKTYKNRASLIKVLLGGELAASGVAREDIGAEVRRALAQVQAELTAAGEPCALPRGEELDELQELATAMMAMGLNAGGAGAEGGGRRRGSTRRGRRVQRGGSYIGNLIELVKAYCRFGGAVAESASRQANLETIVRRVEVDIATRDQDRIRGTAAAIRTYLRNGAAAIGTGMLVRNLGRGPASWTYRLAVALGNLIGYLAPEVSTLGTAVGTAGAAAAAVAVPTVKFAAAAGLVLLAWRAIKYGVKGVGRGTMGVIGALRTAVSSNEGAAARGASGRGAAAAAANVAYRPEWPEPTVAATLGQKGRALKKEAQDVLLRYLSAILFDNPERLIDIRKAQRDADKERTADQLAEIVRQGINETRSSAAKEAARLSAAKKEKEAEAARNREDYYNQLAAAFVGMAEPEPASVPDVRRGAAPPPQTVGMGAFGPPRRGLTGLSAPGGLASAPAGSGNWRKYTGTSAAARGEAAETGRPRKGLSGLVGAPRPGASGREAALKRAMVSPSVAAARSNSNSEGEGAAAAPAGAAANNDEELPPEAPPEQGGGRRRKNRKTRRRQRRGKKSHSRRR